VEGRLRKLQKKFSALTLSGRGENLAAWMEAILADEQD